MGVLFQKGKSGNPAGKPKGSKKKFHYDVAQILNELGYNPFADLVDIARKAKRYSQVHLDAATELAGYVAPKLKQVEFKQDNESPVMFTINLAGKEKEKTNDHLIPVEEINNAL